MIDSSGTVGFDLEKARAGISHYRIENPSNVDTESALKELVDQANLAEDALAEIERLRAELDNYGDDFVCQTKCKDARIKELEAQCEDLMQNCNSLRERAWKAEVRIKEQDDALVEERTGAIRCESYDHCEGMYRIDLPDAMIRAQQELQAEGKIGPDAAKPQSWQITEERKAAIDRGLQFLEWSYAKNSAHDTKKQIAVLWAMLDEVGQCE